MITPWPGALTRIPNETGHRYRVILTDESGWLHARDEAEGTIRTFAPGDFPELDLRDPDTFRGTVARLALAMGAPEEAVAEGVVFAKVRWVDGNPRGRWRWSLSSGAVGALRGRWEREFEFETGDRIDALRRAMERLGKPRDGEW